MKLRSEMFYPALISVCSLIPAGAMAQDGLSYSWLELDYINLDIDPVGEGGNVLDDLDNGGGWGARGSIEFAPNWFAFASYTDTEADVNFVDDQAQFVPADTDVQKLDLGAGFYAEMSDTADIVLKAAYTDVDVGGFNVGATDDASLNDVDDDSSDGFWGQAALRSQLTDQLEGSLGIRYTSIEEVDGVSAVGNLLWEFTPDLGLNLGIDAGDDLTRWLVGLRFTF